jgi:WD40-like Beta Propeller Repeat
VTALHALLALLAAQAPAPARSAPATPELVAPGVISTAADEFGGALSRNGKTLVFNRSIPRSQIYTLFIAHQSGGRWREAEVLPFSGIWRDFDAVLSPDERRIYFISDRADPTLPAGEYAAWVVERSGAGFSAPRPLPAPINAGAGGVHFVSATRDGTLYFTADRPGGLGPVDVWRSRRVGSAYQPAENLGPAINGPGWVNLEAFVTPDEDLLLLGAVGRPGAPGAGDLYLSIRREGRWETPEALGLDINTAAREYSPRVSNDGQWLVFASERGFPIEPRTRPPGYRELVGRLRGVDNGLGNLYRIRLRAVLDDLERRRR